MIPCWRSRSSQYNARESTSNTAISTRGPISRVDDMLEPVERTRPPLIAIPPGSRFVIDVLNEVERDKYWIDGIKPIPACCGTRWRTTSHSLSPLW